MLHTILHLTAALDRVDHPSPYYGSAICECGWNYHGRRRWPLHALLAAHTAWTVHLGDVSMGGE